MLRAADLAAAVGAEMAFEIAALHAAAVKRRCSRSDSGTSALALARSWSQIDGAFDRDEDLSTKDESP